MLTAAPQVDNTQLTSALKRCAAELGFALAGVCPAVTPSGISHFHHWLAAGYAGQMSYLADRAAAYEHPRHVLDGARSIVMLAMPYPGVAAEMQSSAGAGRVSCYAEGRDYHDVVHRGLDALCNLVRTAYPQAKVRGVVDTAPLMEREFAELAGLGWIGKNTLLLSRALGSWFFLAALLTDVELEYDAPHGESHCGTCRACIDACPTGALVDEYVLDARRCISYLTIELRDLAEPELRPLLGDWLFGCDICQAVCPWNDHAAKREGAQVAEARLVPLAELFALDDAQFRAHFRHTALWRARRRGVLRNAALALGNQAGQLAGEDRDEALVALGRGLADGESLVRAASAWALSRFAAIEARQILACRLPEESDPLAAAELRQALEHHQLASCHG